MGRLSDARENGAHDAIASRPEEAERLRFGKAGVLEQFTT